MKKLSASADLVIDSNVKLLPVLFLGRIGDEVVDQSSAVGRG